MKNPFAAAGNQIAHGVLSRLKPKIGTSLATRYVGSSSTIGGIISVASISAEDQLAEERPQLRQRVRRGDVDQRA